MKNKKNGFKNSSIKRIIFLIVLLVLPVNILTLIMTGIIYRKNEQAIFQEIQGGLDRSMHDFENMILAANRRLITLDYSDSDFKSLEFPDPAAERLTLSRNLFNAKEKMKYARQEYTIVDVMFFHFRELDYTIIDGNMGIPVQTVRDMVNNIAQQDEIARNSWICEQMDEIPVLIGCNRWNNADFGILINLNWALEQLNQTAEEPGRYVFLMKNDQSILSDAGRQFLEQEGLLFSELEKSDSYKILQSSSDKYDVTLVEVVKKDSLLSWIPDFIIVLEIIVCAFFILVIPILLFSFHSWIVHPLRKLTDAMDRIEQGEMDVYIEEQDHGSEFEQINRNFNSMMAQVKSLKIDAYEHALKQKNTRMQYLSQQIQPHFILNVLNILYSYEAEEYELSRKTVLLLSRYFRYIVYANREYIELKKEFEFIQNYYAIQMIRFPELFEFTMFCDPYLEDALVPPLLVQNFAENTMKHALKADTHIFVSLTAIRIEDSDRMKILLTDTGPGIPQEVMDQMESFRTTEEHQEGLGVGFENSLDRLRYIYGDQARLLIRKGDSGYGTVVELILPIIKKEETEHESTDS